MSYRPAAAQSVTVAQQAISFIQAGSNNQAANTIFTFVDQYPDGPAGEVAMGGDHWDCLWAAYNALTCPTDEDVLDMVFDCGYRDVEAYAVAQLEELTL